jgi:deoxycytidylate deaminase
MRQWKKTKVRRSRERPTHQVTAAFLENGKVIGVGENILPQCHSETEKHQWVINEGFCERTEIAREMNFFQ